MDGIVWLTEVKSRWPLLARWPIAAKATPMPMPTRRAVAKIDTTERSGLMNHMISATISAVDRPLETPWVRTVPHVLRPVTRSMSLRSVPTMARLPTGKF